jgi:hypothetical protein
MIFPLAEQQEIYEKHSFSVDDDKRHLNNNPSLETAAQLSRTQTTATQ